MKKAKEKVVEIIGYDEIYGLYDIKEGRPNEASPKFELIQDGRERAFRFSLISRHLRWLQGEILTVVEASIDNPKKLAAVKELIKGKISAKISWIYSQCGMPEEEQGGLVYDIDQIEAHRE